MTQILLPDFWTSWEQAARVTRLVEQTYELSLPGDRPAFEVLNSILVDELDRGAAFGWTWAHLPDLFAAQFDQWAEELFAVAAEYDDAVRRVLYRRWLWDQPGRP